MILPINQSILNRVYDFSEYSEEELNNYIDLMKEHFYVDGIINCPYIEGNNIVDTLILIPKTELINV